MFYFKDVKGLPCTEYWHDMKFWWPHNEAIITTLLAYQMTGDEKYADLAQDGARLGLMLISLTPSSESGSAICTEMERFQPS